MKLIYGIGYNSKCKYKSTDGNKISKQYDIWRSMLQRCYSHGFQIKNPSYKGCSVSSQWHNYQDFAQWFNEHDYSDMGYQLDKDILLPNNKIYSPQTCCFIPRDLNVLFTSRAAASGIYPQGVHLHKQSNKYKAQISIDGKVKHLGLFHCADEAYQVYKKAKETYVKEKTLEWKDRIANDVFEALMQWELR